MAIIQRTGLEHCNSTWQKLVIFLIILPFFNSSVDSLSRKSQHPPNAHLLNSLQGYSFLNIISIQLSISNKNNNNDGNSNSNSQQQQQQQQPS